MVSIREADTDWLVNEEYVGVLIPRIGIKGGVRRAGNPAGTEFHEKAGRGRPAGSTVRPEEYVIMIRSTPALEEVEEQVPHFDVDVSCVCAA